MTNLLLNEVKRMMYEVKEATIVFGVESKEEKEVIRKNFVVVDENIDSEGEFLVLINEEYLENEIISEENLDLVKKYSKFVEHLETIDNIQKINIVLHNDNSYEVQVKIN